MPSFEWETPQDFFNLFIWMKKGILQNLSILVSFVNQIKIEVSVLW